MMSKRIKVYSLILVVLFGVLFFLFNSSDSNLTMHTVIIKSADLDTRYDLYSSKDGYVGNFYAKRDVEVKLSDGFHELETKSEGYDSSVITLNVPQVQEVTVNLSKKTAEDVAKEVIGNKEGLVLAKSKLFSNDSWLVSLHGSDSWGSDTEIMVSKKVGDKWLMVSHGTYIDSDLLSAKGAPLELIKYVEKEIK